MCNVIKLTEEQKDAFFEIAESLKDKIYPSNELAYPIDKLIMGMDKESLLAELLNPIKNRNVFLRIAKEIKVSKDLNKTVKELITFYNDPKNEEIWKLEH